MTCEAKQRNNERNDTMVTTDQIVASIDARLQTDHDAIIRLSEARRRLVGIPAARPEPIGGEAIEALLKIGARPGTPAARLGVDKASVAALKRAGRIVRHGPGWKRVGA